MIHNLTMNASYGLDNTTTGETEPPQVSASDLDLKTETALMSISLSIGFIGLILNLVIFVLVLKRYKGQWEKHLILLMNILVCDMCISVSDIVMSSTHIAQVLLRNKFESAGGSTREQEQLHGRFGCALGVSVRLWDLSTNANFFGLLLLSIHHLLAVRWSSRYATAITNRSVIIVCAVSWVIAIILGFVPDILIGSTYLPIMDSWDQSGTTYYCFQRLVYAYFEQNEIYESELKYNEHKVVASSIAIAIVMTTFITMFCVYVYIASLVRSVNKARRAQNDMYRETFHNLKGIGTTILLLACFVLLYFPQTVWFILLTLGKTGDVAKVWPFIFSIAASLSAIVNVLIYAIRNNDIRSVLRSTST